MTITEENYIKAIYHISQKSDSEVSTNAIAEKVNAKASSVTDMLKKLSDKHLISYIKYKGVTLTEKGRLTAVNIVRKHRLWEVFLVDKLNFTWDEVHEVAEQLEHIKSPKLIDELDAFLEFPTHDPHGDPIPDKFGKVQKTNKILLSKAAVNKMYTCVGVIDTSSNFLKYLDKHQISIGTKIRVLDTEDFDKSMTIEVNNKTMVMSKVITTNLYLKEI